MALGYEGFIQVDGKYALGTGTSVPRTGVRIDSSSGYGGRIKTPADEIGIGAPRDYDWELHDGSVNFELNREMWKDVLQPWLFDRQVQKQVYFSSRGPLSNPNVQQYDDAFWNSISISASEQSVVDGSFGFVARDRTDYEYGEEGILAFMNNKEGAGLICPPGTFPKQLNEAVSGLKNINPLPWWNTKVVLTGTVLYFTNWSLDFSQDVVKFFAMTHTGGADPGPKEPEYMAVGPMTVTFSGSYMYKAPLSDTIAQMDLVLADQTFKMKKMELQTISDDVQGADSIVPLTVEYAVYDIDQA